VVLGVFELNVLTQNITNIKQVSSDSHDITTLVISGGTFAYLKKLGTWRVLKQVPKYLFQQYSADANIAV